METKYKVGDKIEITEVDDISKHYYSVGDIGFIKDIYNAETTGCPGYYSIDFNNQGNIKVYSIGILSVKKSEFKLYQEEKPRFHDAQPGDDVYCRLKGNGIIMSLILFRNAKDAVKALRIRFDNGNISNIELDGRHNIDHKEPAVFYRKGENNYLTERPDYEVDWAKVPRDTDVYVSDDIDRINIRGKFLAYTPEMGNYPFWVRPYPNDLNGHKATAYKYCKLAEPCKPEWRK